MWHIHVVAVVPTNFLAAQQRQAALRSSVLRPHGSGGGTRGPPGVLRRCSGSQGSSCPGHKVVDVLTARVFGLHGNAPIASTKAPNLRLAVLPATPAPKAASPDEAGA